MNIESTATTTNISTPSVNSKTNTTTQVNDSNSSPSFADELKTSKTTESTETKEKTSAKQESQEQVKNAQEKVTKEEKKAAEEKVVDETGNSPENTENIDSAIDGLKYAVHELNEATQKENYTKNFIQETFTTKTDEKYEDNILIDNNMNIPEPTEKLMMQTGAEMNFNSNGQPFAEFINNEQDNKLSSSAKDIAEEKAILSSMEENIAIANKNIALSKTKTVENEQGIKKVDRNTNITVDTIVKYDSVIMTEADVDFFANLVNNNGLLNISDIESSAKSAQVSKTLADMLAKAMNDNKPIRIDFDNDISVIIKIDRAGKISADFLPSSQVAEAYLKENLPLLKQRFDDNNIDYNELNQRQRKQEQDQENRKKGRNNE